MPNENITNIFPAQRLSIRLLDTRNHQKISGPLLLQRMDVRATNVDNYARTQMIAIVFNPSPKPQLLTLTFTIPKESLVTTILLMADNNKKITEFETNNSNKSRVVPTMNVVAAEDRQEVTLSAMALGFGRINFSLTYEEHLGPI